MHAFLNHRVEIHFLRFQLGNSQKDLLISRCIDTESENHLAIVQLVRARRAMAEIRQSLPTSADQLRATLGPIQTHESHAPIRHHSVTRNSGYSM
jgi:hypothetical protein